jgi:hypothetical protein
MTGLDLESFLRLMQAETGFWIGAGAVAVALLLLIWAARGRSRTLQRCLILSLAAHVGLVVYGGPSAMNLFTPLRLGLARGERDAALERIRSIELVGEQGGESSKAGETKQLGEQETSSESQNQTGPAKMQEFVPDEQLSELEEEPLLALAPPPSLMPEPARAAPTQSPPAIEAVAPEPSIAVPLPQPREPKETADEGLEETGLRPVASDEKAQVEVAANVSENENEPGEPLSEAVTDRRVGASGTAGPEERFQRSSVPLSVDPASSILSRREPVASDRPIIFEGYVAEPPSRALEPVEARGEPPAANAARAAGTNEEPALALPDLDTRVTRRFPSPGATGAAVRSRGGGGVTNGGGVSGAVPRLAMRGAERTSGVPAVPLVRPGASNGSAGPELPDLGRGLGGRPLPEIPEVYRSRVAPNRSALAKESGASPASEESVARALDWLARHQDADGRWNAGTRRASDGGRVRGDASFTAHCPEGDVCEGECFYWEADTAMTGLALLAYLGAGHTHRGGPHATTVERGMTFLLRIQKPDGDLRGASVNVGIYCHAMAALALCEAYALTGDERLREPVERAVTFLLKARTADGLAWRYQPGDRFGGDTSILGWAVMVLKSAKEVGVSVPEDARRGALTWLEMVSRGKSGGLAVYRPSGGYEVTPTMTAEAWACRQFFGVGGPGPASEEAAAFLMLHGPDRDPFNLYYWYYATLAMYQHGGENWTRWNARVRDQLVRRQERGSHADGSWDPRLCKDKHDSLGGRVYTTALAVLTLEVYYRYLRLYDEPATPTSGDGVDHSRDATVRRTGEEAGAGEQGLLPVPENRER